MEGYIMQEDLKKLIRRPYELGSCKVGGPLDCFGMIREYMYHKNNRVLPLDLKRDFGVKLRWLGSRTGSIEAGNYERRFLENPQEAMNLFETYLFAVFNGRYCFKEADQSLNLGFEEFGVKRESITALKKDDIVIYYMQGARTQSVGIYLGFSQIMICSERNGVEILNLGKDGVNPQRFYKSHQYCCEEKCQQPSPL